MRMGAMSRYRFRLVNVFAETRLGGNPLAVFEDGRGLGDAQMQALALQFNLSETTFILPSTRAEARVRIFTPTFEMPFAGHPTLGTAEVVRALQSTGDRITLEMSAGLIPLEASGDRWRLTANPPRQRVPESSAAEIAGALSLSAADLAGPPLWIDTGSEQLVVPVREPAAVERCRPDPAAMVRHCHNGQRAMAYVWAPLAGIGASVRFFFPKHGAIIEDPGTGSACANLGGYLLATGRHAPLVWTLHQGDGIGRACRLTLHITADGRIGVGGRVIELGRGEIELEAEC